MSHVRSNSYFKVSGQVFYSRTTLCRVFPKISDETVDEAIETGAVDTQYGTLLYIHKAKFKAANPNIIKTFINSR